MAILCPYVCIFSCSVFRTDISSASTVPYVLAKRLALDDAITRSHSIMGFVGALRACVADFIGLPVMLLRRSPAQLRGYKKPLLSWLQCHFTGTLCHQTALLRVSRFIYDSCSPFWYLLCFNLVSYLTSSILSFTSFRTGEQPALKYLWASSATQFIWIHAVSLTTPSFITYQSLAMGLFL